MQKTALKVEKSEAEWREQLTPEQFQVTRKHGTERAFTGPYVDNKEPGLYRCVCCDNPLFRSETKYESGSGWPSFYCAGRARCRRAACRPVLHDDTHRNPLRRLRCPSRPCLRGRPRADRPALLHERRGAELRPRLTAFASRQAAPSMIIAPPFAFQDCLRFHEFRQARRPCPPLPSRPSTTIRTAITASPSPTPITGCARTTGRRSSRTRRRSRRRSAPIWKPRTPTRRR